MEGEGAAPFRATRFAPTAPPSGRHTGSEAKMVPTRGVAARPLADAGREALCPWGGRARVYVTVPKLVRCSLRMVRIPKHKNNKKN